jgi:hypothetical protein
MNKNLIVATVLSGMVIFFFAMAILKSISVIEATLFTLAIIAIGISMLEEKEKYSKAEEEDYLERRRREEEARSLAGVPYLLM